MASEKLLLKDLIIGDKSTLVYTDKGLFVVDVEKTITIDPTSVTEGSNNKWNMVDTTDNTTIHNIYPINDFKQQSYQYLKKPTEQTNANTDFIESFAPNAPYKAVCQFRNSAYGLTDLTTKGVTYADYIFDDNMYQTYTKTFSENQPRCYVFPSSGVISTDTSSGFSTVVPLYNLSNIQYNYICEFPLDLRYYNYGLEHATSDFSTNLYFNTYADSFTGKNEYDIWYGVNSRMTSGDTTHSLSAYVEFCRTYEDINSTGDIVYMTFRNDKFYNTSAFVDVSSSGVEFGMLPTSSFMLTGKIADIPLTQLNLQTHVLSSAHLSSDISHLYDNVEIIQSINRIKAETTHKSNMFSINIQNANINNNISLSEDEKDNIKLLINNSIYNIITKITPANTQLFGIYWTGE